MSRKRHKIDDNVIVDGAEAFTTALNEAESVVDEQKLRGNFEECGVNGIRGWLINENNPSEPTKISVLIDGTLYAEINADVFRQDLLDADIGNGCHSFNISSPITLFDGLTHKIEVISQENGFVLHGSPKNYCIHPEEYKNIETTYLTELVDFISKRTIEDETYPKDIAYSTLGYALEELGSYTSAMDCFTKVSHLPNIESCIANLSKKIAKTGSELGKNSNMFFGTIDDKQSSNDIITGWLYSPMNNTTPALFIDGQQASLKGWPLPRADVQNSLGITENVGFSFNVPYMKRGAQIQLYAVIENSLHLAFEHKSEKFVPEKRPFSMLTKALEIAQQPDSVAIVCWDGAHNPIGRAKVLYDIVATHRPVILISYLFDEFGGKIWAPLSDCDFSILTIPWNQRDIYHNLMRQMGIVFNTVWMCKPRFPTFLLTSVVATPNARLILDFDDNEEHFALASSEKNKPYSLPTNGLSKFLTEKISTRTVVSCTLQQDFGGIVVRHVRTQPESMIERRNLENVGIVKIGFIGTVRPHKNILAAAKAIRFYSWVTKKNVQFHVYGDVAPNSLRDELLKLKVEVQGIIPSNELNAAIESMDIILTGFPSSDNANSEITRYQMTAKIGDALSMNRPVLVPHTPATEDIENIPGVFLFNEVTFTNQLTKALAFKENIVLPEQFDVYKAYDLFTQAEISAKNSLIANEVFSHLATPQSQDSNPKPALLLIWKQNDAGIYGRRIDQIARSYKRIYPEHDVIILELLHKEIRAEYEKNAGNNSLSEVRNILNRIEQKETKDGYIDRDGVNYSVIQFKSSDFINISLVSFLAKRNLLPQNTIVVLFPIIRFFDKIQEILFFYKTIVDVVDNQFSWKGSSQLTREKVIQYNQMLTHARHVVFNSAINKKHFEDQCSINDSLSKMSVVPNWYEIPKLGYELSSTVMNNQYFNIVYSGNMNDRVNWQLINELCDFSELIRIHLIGTAERANESFTKLLYKPNVIYHGSCYEEVVVNLLFSANLAIMPHIADDVSNFMNPLKLHMYRAAGVPAVASKVEGIEENDLLDISETDEDFFEAVKNHFNVWKNDSVSVQRLLQSDKRAENALKYVNIISHLRNSGN